MQQAASNTASQHSTNKSTSSSVSISYGTGGWGGSIAGSKGRGNADGSDTTWSNTHVEAGHQLNIQANNDVNLKGAVASADQVSVKAKNNLNVESLQDTSSFDSKQKSFGVNVSVGYGKMSGSLNLGKSKINSDYASVIEQSGIRARDGGFEAQVGNNTDLKGGIIDSTSQAAQNGKNSLKTGSLTSSDINNYAHANASTGGISVSSNMANQGRYGLGKAAIANGLANSQASDASAGVTRSAIQAATVTITDDAAQLARTGKTAAQAIADINTDTANAQTAARKMDHQAMERSVQAERAIKEAIIAEAFKLSDETYRVQFLEKSVLIELKTDPITGKKVAHLLSEKEKRNLKPAKDGKIHVSTNGIFNDQEAAVNYAMQHGNADGTQYVAYFPQANNVVSELMVAAYQKFLENDSLGLTNTTQEIKHIASQYGQTGLQLDGHSRGSLTIGNFLESKAKEQHAQGSLSNTTVRFFGPAYNAQKADGFLSLLQNRPAMDDMQARMDAVLKLQNHADDPVGTLIGGNPATGGTTPSGSNHLTQMIRAATGQKVTSHNCYGDGGEQCRKFWSDSPNRIPILKPISNIVAP